MWLQQVGYFGAFSHCALYPDELVLVPLWKFGSFQRYGTVLAAVITVVFVVVALLVLVLVVVVLFLLMLFMLCYCVLSFGD